MNNLTGRQASMATPAIDLTKRAIFEGRILQTVVEYVEAFNAPCPIKILSAKYSRSLMSLGGLPECLTEMKNAKKIRIFLTRSGGKAVLPMNSSIVVEDAVEL